MNRLFVIIFFFLCASAKAQSPQQLFWALLRKPVPSPLDTITSVPAKVVYSARRTKNTYAGYAARVRRSSDDTELDIGFNSDGGFDDASFSAFVGAGSGYVSIWYDQSGNAMNAVQTTLTSQPLVALNSISGKASLYFDGNDYFDIPGSAPYFNSMWRAQTSVSAVMRFGTSDDPNVAYSFLSSNAGSVANTGYSFWYDDRVSLSRNNAALNYLTRGATSSIQVQASGMDVITPNAFHILNIHTHAEHATASLRSLLWVDNVQKTMNNTRNNLSANNTSTFNLEIGRMNTAGHYLVGNIAEMIIATGLYSTNQRTDITTNQNIYYNVY